jgi:hypothetical protein
MARHRLWNALPVRESTGAQNPRVGLVEIRARGAHHFATVLARHAKQALTDLSRRHVHHLAAQSNRPCRQLEITESTWHRWRNQYGGMKANDAKRLKELEKENASLKRIVANQALDIDMLKFVAEGKF